MKKYRFGQKLKTTLLALNNRVFKAPRRGVFISQDEDKMIRVVVEGKKTVEKFHIDFWEKC